MKVFLDTAPLIYLVEGRENYADRVETQLNQWVSAGAVFASSTLTLMELLIVPKRQKNESLVRKYRALLEDVVSVPLTVLTPDIVETAAGIRAEYGLMTPDSIQVASAFHTGADIFYTNDHRLKRCEDLAVLTVDG